MALSLAPATAADLVPLSNDTLAAAAAANVKWVVSGNELILEATGDGEAELTIPAPTGKWDLGSSAAVVMTVRDLSDQPLTVRGRIENDSAKAMSDTCL